MNKSITAFLKFGNKLKKFQEYRNGSKHFTGKVIYKWNGQVEEENLKVTLHYTTFEEGKVQIDDGFILKTDNVHLDFNPMYQDYKVDSEGALVIKGDSPKVGGEYEVTIFEE